MNAFGSISTLNFGSFPGTIAFIVNMSPDQISAHYKKHKAWHWKMAFEATRDFFQKGVFGYAAKRVLENKKTGAEKDYFFIVLCREFNFDDFDMSSLAHEVLHIISYNLPTMFDPMKENEAFCYTHTHIMRQALTELRRLQKKSNGKRRS